MVKNEYTPKRQSHGWDKPVIHLYGPDVLAVNIKVATPQGHPTAYFPSATLEQKTINVTDAFALDYYTLTDCFGLEWSGRLSAQPQGALPAVDPEHWWARVRQVPSAYIQSKDNQERFLFYEVTAFQDPVVVADVSADEMMLKLSRPTRRPHLPNTEETKREPVGPVLVIVNNGTKHWLRRIDTITAKQPVTLKRADILQHPATDQEILVAAQSQWQAYGLTKHETAAIVHAWKADLLGTFGFLLSLACRRHCTSGCFR